MKKRKKRVLASLLAAVMMVAVIPWISTPVFAVVSPNVDLGDAVLSSDGAYYYPSAAVSGSGVRTILISFSDNVTSGDEIDLPADTPTGFTVSGSSNDNDYAKRINLDGSVDASTIQSYLRSVGFTVASATQTVNVTLTMENINVDTYYSTGTQHYYQFIPAGSSGVTWTDAYDNAKDKSYMGRSGYLATVMSLDEDTFLNALSGGKTGWLGGTIMTNGGIRVDAGDAPDGGGLYYNGFVDSVVSTGWYWACGPEIGTVFYNKNSINDVAGASEAARAANADAANAGNYYNWSRSGAYEPNNSAPDHENCLTTLELSGCTGKHGTSFTWNDIRYNNTDQSSIYSAKGYFVEYGDRLTGDSGSDSAAFASDSDTLTEPSDIELTTVSWTSSSAFTCDIELPDSAEMVTISVDSGYFNVPSSYGSALTFLGGTNGTNYIDSCDSGTQFASAVFSFTNVTAAENMLDDIVYTPDGTDPQTITAVSSAVSPEDNDIYFDGHFYRYVDSGTHSISWINAVSAAGITTDPYFGGRGYLATATTQAENSILLRLVDTGGSGDHWDDAWMGGLWQRNTGTRTDPAITRGVDGNEIDYDDLVYFIENDTVPNVLLDYTIQYGAVDSSTYIYDNPETVRYYWIDGPEAGEELPNNTIDFAPWHDTSGSQDEPNSGDFIYIGWQGAYWDDLSAYSGDSTLSGYDKLDGYIVEFSGFDGGSTEGIIKEDTKTVDTTVPNLTAGAVSRTSDTNATVKFTSNEAGYYYYSVVDDNATEPAIDTSGTGTGCTTSETTISLTALTAGAKDIYIKAKDSSGNVSSVLKIDVPAYTASSDGSRHSSSSSDEGAPVIVNGTTYSAGDAEDSTENGKTVTTVTVNTSKLQKILDSQSENPSVIVPVTGDAEVASGILTGQMIDDMEKRNAILSLQTDSVTYTVPASEINIRDVSEQLGEDVDLSDIIIDIRISEPSADTVSVVENAAKDGGFTVMIPAVDFDINCTSNGKTVEVKAFNVYVRRTVLIPDGVDPEKITTGVVIKPDGTSYHVPTQITVIDGKYYAIINSLTNSTYTVVWHPAEFMDVANHWSKGAVNDMGSRMVISGIGGNLFMPDRNITRAEFAAIVVRALGLDTGMGENSFTDVSGSDWYSGYVKTAVGYGIINGMGDGTFRPNSSITREQAMTMIARAMKITGLEPELSDTKITSLLSGYGDDTDITNYARDTIAACLETGVVLGRDNGTIAPGSYITRAEVAVIVQRLLKKSELI